MDKQWSSNAIEYNGTTDIMFIMKLTCIEKGLKGNLKSRISNYIDFGTCIIVDKLLKDSLLWQKTKSYITYILKGISGLTVNRKNF